VSITAVPDSSIDPRLRAMAHYLGAPEEKAQLGSGVIVSANGNIITNLHVLEGAAIAEIHLSDGRTLPAKLLGADARADIAILQIDAAGLTPLPFGNSDEVRVGQIVFAVGNPFGLQESVTQGIISAKSRRFMMSEAANEFFQTDAGINPGNSGGPLVDVRGRLIGINNSIFSNTGGSQGIGFAIPSNVARRVYEDILQYGRVIHPWFGVEMRPITPQISAALGLGDSSGALVAVAFPDSPAGKAGILPGDVITSFNGRPIIDSIDLRNRVAETKPGQKVALKILREGKPVDLDVLIEAQPGN